MRLHIGFLYMESEYLNHSLSSEEVMCAFEKGKLLSNTVINEA